MGCSASYLAKIRETRHREEGGNTLQGLVSQPLAIWGGDGHYLMELAPEGENESSF